MIPKFMQTIRGPYLSGTQMCHRTCLLGALHEHHALVIETVHRGAPSIALGLLYAPHG